MDHPSPFVVMPWQMQGQQQQLNRPMLGNETPARVRAAMEFLNQLTFKTMLRPAAGPSTLNVEVVAGQPLGKEEVLAQCAACRMLADYFGGKLRPDRWERYFLQTSEAEAESRMPDGKGQYLQCPACPANAPRHNCIICSGTGGILAYPFAEGR